MSILSEADYHDAPDRYETVTMSGNQTVDVALVGNTRGILSQQTHQYGRLSVVEMTGCDAAKCERIMRRSIGKRDEIYDMDKNYGISMAAYDPKAQNLNIRSIGRAQIFLIIQDNKKVKVVKLTSDDVMQAQRHDIDVAAFAKEAAKKNGIDVTHLKAGLLVTSEGLLEAHDPDVTYRRYGEKTREEAETLIESLYIGANKKARAAGGGSISKIMTEQAVEWRTGDNMAVIWMPDLLANQQGEPIIACIADTVGRGDASHLAMRHFETECQNTLGIRGLPSDPGSQWRTGH